MARDGTGAVDELRELDALLGRDAAAEGRRAARVFDELAGPFAAKLVLHGAGNLGAKVAEGLRRNGIEPVAFSDGNPAAQGKERAGLPVLAPREAADRYGQTAAFVVTVWNHACGHAGILEQLRALGCQRVVPLPALFYKYPSTFLPYYHLDLPQKILLDAPRVREAFTLLRDGESRRELLQTIRGIMDLALPGSPRHGVADQYFPADLREVPPDEVLLDVGAFDGDTIESFVARTKGAFRRVIAFEPDPANFARMQERLARMPDDVRRKIEARREGAADAAGRISFQCDGTSSSGVVDLAAGTISVDVLPLDRLGPDVHPTYVKMDIEGMEPLALRGARRLIQEHAPALAVCVYHRLEHFWEVPLTIAEIRPGYALYLRRYGEWPWETVCYAIPERRT